MTIVDRLLNVPGELAAKAPCLVATTADIVLSGLQTIDGVALAERQRVLVIFQDDPIENGIYSASSGNWLRPNDANGNEAFIAGTTVWVTSGTLNNSIEFILICPDDPVLVGTSQLTWAATKRVGEDAILRAIHQDDHDTDADLTLPLQSFWPNTVIGFDAGGRLQLVPIFAGLPVPTSDNINYTLAATGAHVRTLTDKLGDVLSVFDFIPAAQHAAIVSGSTSYDATADINAAVTDANGADVHFPVGTFLTQGITRLTSVTDEFRNGMKLIGQGRSTNIVLTANNGAALLWDVGYVPDGTSATAGKYTRGSEVRGMLITQAPGVTGGDGIRLTAAWDVRFTDVWVEDMSHRAVNVPFRSDIFAAVSDFWQCFGLDFQQCAFTGSTDWGVYMGGGQSPGLWKMQFATIANNAGGGVFDTTGQFIFTDNVIVGNGTFAANGGMLIDASIEGVSFNALLERNEFDTNFVYHLWMLRCRNHRLAQNRFLSETYLTDTSGTLSSGSSHMRPQTHVKLGDGGTEEVWNTTFECNYHRTVTGAGPTTAGVNAYAMTGGSTQVLRNRFLNNDIQGRDGVAQNSTGMVRYANLGTANNNTIIEGNPVHVIAVANGATSIIGTASTVVFASETLDTHGAFGSGTTFTAPVAGVYEIKVSVAIAGLASGNTATLGVLVNGSTLASDSKQASGSANLTVQITTDLALAEGDLVSASAQQDSGTAKNTVATGNLTRFVIAQLP